MFDLVSPSCVLSGAGASAGLLRCQSKGLAADAAMLAGRSRLRYAATLHLRTGHSLQLQYTSIDIFLIN